MQQNKNYITPEQAEELIEIRGYRKTWIAEQMGLKPDTLTKFLHHKVKLGKPALVLLAKILGAEEKAG